MGEKQITGDIFWILFLLLALGSLIFLGIWSFHNGSIKGIALTAIFSIMIFSGVIFSKFEIFKSGDWSENSLSFMVGFILFLFIGWRSQDVAFSFLSISENGLFATISSELPRVLEFTMHAFVIPIAEETFWIIGLPLTIISLMMLIGKQYKAFKNPWLQLIVVVVISGVTFAAFHVGKLFISFLAVAFIFRALMLISTIGDAKFNIIPILKITPAFAIGAHIGNNWGTFGITDGISIIFSSFWLALIFLGVGLPLLFGALNEVGLLLEKGGVKR